MSAAADKRTSLALLTLLAFLAVSIVGASAAAPADRDKEPPSAPQNLRVVSATQDRVTLAWDPSQDDVGVAGYYVYGDRGKATVDQQLAKPEFTVSELKCGQSVQLSVIAFDDAHNRSERATTIASAAACADTTPPSSPTGFTQLATAETAVVLAWAASSDDVGVVRYGVYRNLEQVANPNSPSVPLPGLACGRTYDYAVDAVDAAGNRSRLSRAYVRTASCPTASPPPSDTQPPSTPTGFAVSNVQQTSLTLRWNGSADNVGVAGYDVFRDGAKVGSPSATSANVSGLSCGTTYAFAVQARDAAGNTSARAQMNVATATCPNAPQPPAPPPADAQAPSTPGSLRVSSATAATISLAWNASTDNVAVAGYRTYRNGTHVATDSQTSSTVSNLSCGSAYTFEVSAFDAAGNASPRASVTGSTQACPDTEPPSAPANVVASSRTVTSIALTWSSSFDDVGVTGYGLYEGGVAVGATAGNTGIFSGLTCNTNYTLAIDARDAAGNRSTKTTLMVSTTACPDTAAPTEPTGLAGSSVTQTGLTLSWNAASDDVGVTGYDVYRNGTKVATVTSTSASQSGLACGTSYSFGVRARDAAGNVSSMGQLNVVTSTCAAPPPSPGPSATVPYFAADWANGTFGSPWTSLFSYTGSGSVSVPSSGPQTQTPDGRVRVAPSPSGSGNAARFEIRDSDPAWPPLPDVQKSEARTVTEHTFDKSPMSVGDVRWFSTRVYLPYTATEKFEWAHGGSQPFTDILDLHTGSSTGWPAFSTGIPAWESKEGDANRWINFLVYGGNYAETTHFEAIRLWQVTDSSGKRVMSNHNRWIDLVWGVRFAPDNTGWIEVWVDGANVYPRRNRPTMWAGDTGMYFKYGLYKRKDASFPETGRSVLYYGRTTIGLTKP